MRCPNSFGNGANASPGRFSPQCVHLMVSAMVSSSLCFPDSRNYNVILRLQQPQRAHVLITQLSVRVDHKNRSRRTARNYRFRAIKRRDFSARIRKQTQRQIVMLGKLAMRVDRVGRNTNHFRASRLIVFPTIAHRAHLPRANRRFVTRIKKQDDDLAAMIRKLPVVSAAVLQHEIRCGFVEVEFVAHAIRPARISSASSTSSSVLKKCGEMRKPAPGRQSTNTRRSASCSATDLASSTPIITEPPRFFNTDEEVEEALEILAGLIA